MHTPFLAFLNRHAREILAGGIFAGLIIPDLASLMQPLMQIAVLASLSLSMLRLDWSTAAAWLGRPLRAFIALGWMLLLAPAMTLAAVRMLDLPEGLSIALVLAAAAPPLTASPALALLLGLDASLSLILLVAGLAMLPLTLAAVSFWLLGLELTTGPAPFLLRIGIFVGLPFLVSAGIRRLVSRQRLDAHAVEINGLIVVALVIFAIAVMDGVAARLIADPWTVGMFTASAFTLNICLQAVGAGAFFWLGWRGALTMGLASGYRNMAIMLVLTAGIAGPDMSLYVAIAQFPIFVMPMLSNPLYRRVLVANT